MPLAATAGPASYVTLQSAYLGPAGPSRLATVLLIDDDDDTRLLVRCLLRRTGRFEIVGEAASGQEGIQRAAMTRPDFVVLDVQMPGMSGLDALPKILETSPDSRVVVLSGLEPARISLLAQTRGAVAVLAKAGDCSSLVPPMLLLDAQMRGEPEGRPLPRQPA